MDFLDSIYYIPELIAGVIKSTNYFKRLIFYHSDKKNRAGIQNNHRIFNRWRKTRKKPQSLPKIRFRW